MNAEVQYESKDHRVSFRNKNFTRFLKRNEMISIVQSEKCIGPKYTYCTTKKYLDHIVMY